MGDYFVSDEVYRIHLRDHNGSDDYVEVKDELTDKDQRALLVALKARGAEVEIDDAGNLVVTGNADMETYADVILTRCVRAWSLTSKGGAPMPITPKTIEALKGGLSTFIMVRAQEHYNAQRLTPEEAKNFAGPPSPPSSTAAHFPNGSLDSPSANGSASIPTPHSASGVIETP